MLGWAAAGKLARGLRGRGARAEATLAAGSNQVRARGAGPRPSPCLRTAPPWPRRRPLPPCPPRRWDIKALGLAEYARDFLDGGGRPGDAVLRRTSEFFTDATLCGASALALRTNAPLVLREEALSYAAEGGDSALGRGATVFGSGRRVRAEKAALANCAAVREWDSNGTNFGFHERRTNHRAGEFGHNDYYPAVVAACQQTGRDGAYALRAMVLLDEIRGRLAEVFSLKTYKVDHVLHGAVASAVVYGTIMGATARQVESAVGLVVAHHVPFRAIRAGHQLSDSKGSSAAISTEAALAGVHRSLRGFQGPRDIFRNPEAVFRLFGQDPALQAGPASGDSPFDLHLATDGDDFAVMGMHFKLGLYEHQSAGAIQALLNILGSEEGRGLLNSPGGDDIARIRITAYEPAYGIIGDPAKMNPRTRQSADHSMAYIVSTLVRKALEAGRVGAGEEAWKDLMLGPHDYDAAAIHHPVTRALMSKVEFRHGGPEYDERYPDGIPTSVTVESCDRESFLSGLVMYPGGHARNTEHDLQDILDHKFRLLGGLAFEDPDPIVKKLLGVGGLSAADLDKLQSFPLREYEREVDA